jgi:hypothetical protein
MLGMVTATRIITITIEVTNKKIIFSEGLVSVFKGSSGTEGFFCGRTRIFEI